ncbi:MAG TPA: two-component regulator propeller domain-containing protein [Thermoanaerobaculia bacterium]|nr:two-component regulator propeller domain-containing protein [Thermoanaerobaculia bacterium]
MDRLSATRILFVAGLFVSAGSWASTVGRVPGNPGWVHETFTVDDGLPRAGIARAVQTRDGYLWLATFDGLVRFDGSRFEVFDSARVPALGSNRIFDLQEARDGSLWIRTEQGHVARFAGGVFTACGAPRAGRAPCTLSGPGAAEFTHLAQDAAGTLWIGGRSGLFRVSGNELQAVPGLETGAEVQAVLRDRSGRLWVATARGLFRGRPGRFERIALPPDPFDRLPPTLAEDAEGEVWIGTDQGAGRFRNGRFTAEIPGPGAVGGDGRGGVWIALPDRVLRYRAGRLSTVAAGPAGPHILRPDFSLFDVPGGEVWIASPLDLYRNGAPLPLPGVSKYISSILPDREGTLWVSTSRSGELHALHPARVVTFDEGLPSPNVYPLYEDRDGTIWAGGGGFLASLAPGDRRFRSLEAPGGLQHEVHAFLRDRAGTFWVGTGRGLYVLRGDGLAPVSAEALRRAAVRAFREDSRGNLWVGTEEGLFRRSPDGRWQELGEKDGLHHPRIRAIHETPDGALWLASNGGGVIRYARGRFTAFTRAQGLASDLVRTISPAPDGRLWIGTENGGLSRLDPSSAGRPEGPSIANVDARQGLYTDGIHQIVDDGLGNFWMSSNQGIFRAAIEDLNAVADGRKERLDTMALTERDGMADREANGSSGLRDRSGRIWFPTVQGVVRVDPREALRWRRPPPVHVARLRAAGAEIPFSGGAVRLSPAQRSFAVEFSAPSFRAPERQRFRVRLTPYDRDWVDVGARREVFYTKVPSGQYVFEVLASGPDGEWNEEPAALRLEVVPRFFETGWFRVLAALASFAALTGLVAGVVRLREARLRSREGQLHRLVEERTATIALQAERLRELDQVKNQFFANVSHELRTPLALTLGPLEDALEGRFGPVGGEVAGQLEVAARNARRLLGLVDQLLDVARLDAGGLRLRMRPMDLSSFVRQRVEAFLPLAERRSIELSLEAPRERVEVWLDRIQFEKVLDNLLGNALKFTPRGGRVQVVVSPYPGRVEVRVRDNGPGIPAGQLDRIFERFYQAEGTSRRRWPGAGIGLSLAKELVELHRGSIAVESVEGKGSCFTVTLLRGRNHVTPEMEEGGPEDDQRYSGERAVLVLDDTLDLPPAENPAAGDDRTTVLVVDDNAEMRAYVRRHLEPDYRVVEAADGLQGLAEARRLTPDLVVSDVMMPGLDGSALFRALREDPELDFIPVVLLTAKASTESRIQGLRDGVDDYLVKPFDSRELKARVDNLIASRRRLKERLDGIPPRPLRAAEVTVVPADEAFLARVQAVVEERLGDTDLSVEGLAEALRCDRSYLLRKLRALTGETPSGLIRSLRLQRAEQLLRAGAGTVSEIAGTVGFKSVAHFSNAFQERYGERPSAFAARHRGQ